MNFDWGTLPVGSVCAPAAESFCGETNLMLIDSWARSFSERFVKNERCIDFSHFFRPDMTACDFVVRLEVESQTEL